MAARKRIGDIRKLGADGARLIEWNFHGMSAVERSAFYVTTDFTVLAGRTSRDPVLSSERNLMIAI